MRSYDVVIVGGGPAGRTIVHTLHEHHAGLSIAVIKDEAINVNRCAVPYGINAEDPIEKFQIPNKLVSDFGAELIVESVERLDPKGKTVTLASGETIGYDKLVLATGARPFVPPIEGIESENITFVRSLADLERLRQLAAKSREVVILGGGYIGVEVAVVLKDMGLSVSLVEMQPTILGGTAEPELTEVLLAAMMEHGIHLHTERRVVKFLDNGAVELNNGSEVPGDFVVVAAGVRPDISLAEAAGLNVSKHGVVVDDHMRSVSHPDIYACGDCAQGTSFFTGLPVPSEFGTNAVFMGRVVAANIMGAGKSYIAKPWFWSDQYDVKLQIVGL
ncbi:MAG: FAD-dependent oxidoreductase, partial [Alphaproteobacteria bacterium]